MTTASLRDYRIITNPDALPIAIRADVKVLISIIDDAETSEEHRCAAFEELADLLFSDKAEVGRE